MRQYEPYYNQYLNTNPNPIVPYNKWVANNSVKPSTKFSVEIKIGDNTICKRKWHYINTETDFTGFYPEMIKIIHDNINVNFIDPNQKPIFTDTITIVFTNNDEIVSKSFISNRTQYKIDIKDKVNRFKNLMGLKEKSFFVPPVYETPAPEPKKLTFFEKLRSWVPYPSKVN